MPQMKGMKGLRLLVQHRARRMKGGGVSLAISAFFFTQKVAMGYGGYPEFRFGGWLAMPLGFRHSKLCPCPQYLAIEKSAFAQK
jgi:hypothetical protein